MIRSVCAAAGAISLSETPRESETKSAPETSFGLARRVYHKLLLMPRLPSSLRYIQSDYATVFMMHRFRDGEPGATGVDVTQLRKSLAYLRKNAYELISLEELMRRLDGRGPRLRGAVAFTVDDGYLDQAELGAPVFAEFDCPVTTFVTTGFLDGTLWLWWDKIEYIFERTRRSSLAVQLGETTLRYDLDTEFSPAASCADFVERCKSVPDAEKHLAISRLAEEANVDLPDGAPAKYAPMTWEHVRRCEEQTMAFGAHTVSHPILSQAQPEKARTEIEESWRRVREEARNPVPIFCYPSGRVDDFGAREIETLERLGFLGALSAEAGFADPLSFQRGPQRRFEISRMPFPEDLSVIAQYAGGIERFKQSVRRRKGRHGASLR